MDPDDLFHPLNPLNPLSPLSPLNPANPASPNNWNQQEGQPLGTKQPAPEWADTFNIWCSIICTLLLIAILGWFFYKSSRPIDWRK